MNLGIAGRKAIVCASTRGLGRACAEALLAEGVHVVVNGRDAGRTAAVAAALAERWPGQVAGVTADVTRADGRQALLAACPEPDILVNNNAGPETGAFASFDEAAWLDALSASMVAPLMLVRAVVPGMRRRGFGRIVNVTSAMVGTPRPGMALSSGARAGLTAALKGLLTEAARDNVTVNNLLPERFDTDRQVQMAHALMQRHGLTWDQARVKQTETVPAGRLGRPEEFGATCAFVCGAQAGYMTGMNIRLDGGSHPGLL